MVRLASWRRGGFPTRTALALACALLLAGCFASDEPPAAAPGDGSASEAPAASVAGTPYASAPVPDAAAPMLLPISFSGTTPQGTCSMLGCQYVTQGSEDFHLIEHAGRATLLHAEVTYADQEPGMEFYVGVCIGQGSNENDVECGQYTTGASPLVVDFALDTADPVALSLGSLSTAAAPSGTMVFGEASFDVTGALTVMAPSAS